MNSAYSSLINSMPSQMSIPEQILNYTTQTSTDSPLLSQLYNPAYAAAAQNRLLSSLQSQTGINPAASPNHNSSTNSGNSTSNNNNNNNNNNTNSNNNNNSHNTLTPPESNISSEPSQLPPPPPPFPSMPVTGADLTSPNPSPFYPTTQTFPNNITNNNIISNNNLCCDFNSAWRSAAHIMAADHNPYISYENAAWANPYGCIGNPSLDLNTARRKNATRESTSTLKAWLQEHIKNPYPTKGEKIMLAIITKMTLTQVSTWFANARRRLKKENKMTWSPKNRSDDDGNSSDQDMDLKNKDCDNFENECNNNNNNSIANNKKDNQSDSISDNEDIRGKFSSPNNIISSSANILTGSSGIAAIADVKPKIWSLAHTATSGLFPSPSLMPHPPIPLSMMDSGGGGPLAPHQPLPLQPTHLMSNGNGSGYGILQNSMSGSHMPLHHHQHQQHHSSQQSSYQQQHGFSPTNDILQYSAPFCTGGISNHSSGTHSSSSSSSAIHINSNTSSNNNNLYSNSIMEHHHNAAILLHQQQQQSNANTTAQQQHHSLTLKPHQRAGECCE